MTYCAKLGVRRSLGHLALAWGALIVLNGQPMEVLAADAPAGGTVSDAVKAEAKTLFASRCATCHGAAGKGDGAAAAGLNPKPRDMSDAAWQKSVSDEHIEKIILLGGPAVGMSPLMPPNPDLSGKPEVVKALRMLVRDMGASPAK